jgi:hypothetical protein
VVLAIYTGNRIDRFPLQSTPYKQEEIANKRFLYEHKAASESGAGEVGKRITQRKDSDRFI